MEEGWKERMKGRRKGGKKERRRKEEEKPFYRDKSSRRFGFCGLASIITTIA